MLAFLRAAVKRVPYARAVVRWARGIGFETVHGMTSRNEQDYLRHYAAKIYSGTGEIVDLGCWLGSTTIPLAQGLRQNANRAHLAKRIHSYDLFIWESWMDSHSAGCAKTYVPGEMFLDEFTTRTKDFQRWIRVYPGDIMEIGWNGQPIEFLLVDAMKSPNLAKYIVREFYGNLLPRTGLLFHQDFKHFYTSWIHLIQYKLRDYFDPECSLKDSSGVVFRLKKPFDCDLSWLDHLESVSDGEVDDAFGYSLSLVGADAANVAAAKVMHFIHAKRPDTAKIHLKRFVDGGLSINSDLSECAERLKKETCASASD